MFYHNRPIMSCLLQIKTIANQSDKKLLLHALSYCALLFAAVSIILTLATGGVMVPMIFSLLSLAHSLAHHIVLTAVLPCRGWRWAPELLLPDCILKKIINSDITSYQETLHLPKPTKL